MTNPIFALLKSQGINPEQAAQAIRETIADVRDQRRYTNQLRLAITEFETKVEKLADKTGMDPSFLGQLEDLCGEMHRSAEMACRAREVEVGLRTSEFDEEIGGDSKGVGYLECGACETAYPADAARCPECGL